ncbi:MAG: 23S rRNA (pseudouridine(1915)-N(3))-methyltransferase RlmH [Zhenhengia sp.]|uniref:23S rRNA (pseudouridine(1915)-N(3))-methyltransferase RlmH n=1 Tax=Zhenhengia sp. TaxID=2944208 RepID=UPI00399366E7
MNFKIYTILDKPDKFYLQAIKEYTKRLNRYCKTSFIHLKSHEQLQKKLTNKSYRILITPKGNHLTSEELAHKINSWGVSGTSDISIIIGSTDLDSDEQIAISSMDMDLGLTTTVTFEQIYRAYRILNNQPYHK